jgi:hypothetical protein
VFVWPLACTLELRVFPKGVSQETSDLENHLIQGLFNCINLNSCVWTRDGSLTNDILLTLQAPNRANLKELEINAHSNHLYDASLLPNFASLRRLVLIMPDADTVKHLTDWCANLGESLRELSVICKASLLAMYRRWKCDISNFLEWNNTDRQIAGRFIRVFGQPVRTFSVQLP